MIPSFLQGFAGAVKLDHVSFGVKQAYWNCTIASNNLPAAKASPAADPLPKHFHVVHVTFDVGAMGLTVWLQLAEHHGSLQLTSLSQQTV